VLHPAVPAKIYGGLLYKACIMPVTRSSSAAADAAETLLQLNCAPLKFHRYMPLASAINVAPRTTPKRKAAIVARQMIKLCAEAELDA
jgi:hypothetical protein